MDNNVENHPSIYDKEGRVTDPETARVGADVENEYRKKILGIFDRSQSHIDKGERAAEMAMENTIEIDPKDVPREVEEVFDNYSNSISGALGLKQVGKGDVGEGIERYRLLCEVDKGLAGFVGMPMSETENVLIIADVKDGQVISSDVISTDSGYKIFGT